MKRYGNLYNKITDIHNLLLASSRAQSGKRFRDDVLLFNYNLESNLFQLQSELVNKIYIPGAYKIFKIYEPKERMISAAPYRDRVVHHSLCTIIEPIFNNTFIDSCYANRIRKGTHKALNHFVEKTGKYRYVLRADIEKYFASIDHQILKEIISRKIKCPETLWLIELILDNSNKQEEVIRYFPGDEIFTPYKRHRGLPIGNLTSQLWANVYLNELDHLIAQKYGGKQYLRYVDDIVLFSDSKEELIEARNLMDQILCTLRLRLHPVKTEIIRTNHGANFLGFRMFPDTIRVRQENLRRGRRRLRQMKYDFKEGGLSLNKIKQSIKSWIAHLSYGNTVRLREKIFSSLVFSRN